MTATMTLPLADPDVPTLDELQATLIDAVFAEWARGVRSTILQSPTGSGKTRMATLIIKRLVSGGARRALFVCPMRELVKQAAAEFRAAGLPVAIEMAERRALDRIDDTWGGGARVVVGCTATLKGPRLARWPADAFDLVVADECHLWAADSTLVILGHFSGASRVLGLSATPFRMDRKPLYRADGAPFQTVACRYELPEAIGNGHLCDLTAVTCQMAVDLTGVCTTKQAGGIVDFSLGQMEERLSAGVEPLANAFRMEIERLGLTRCLLIAPRVASARALAQAFTQIGVTAKAVHGDTKDHPMPWGLAETTIAQYREGDLPVLCSCSMLNVGFNDPPTQALLMARATRSTVLFQQAIGRVTRTWPGKDAGYVIAPRWVGAKGVVDVLSLFSAKEPSPKVRKIAQRLAEERKEVKPNELLEEARKLAQREEEDDGRRAARLRIKAEKKAVEYRRSVWSPYGAANLFGVKVDPKPTYNLPDDARATVGQRGLLAAYGIGDAGTLDKDTASRLVAATLDREFKRMVSPKQVALLVRAGWSPERAASLTHREFARVIGDLKRGWAQRRRA